MPRASACPSSGALQRLASDQLPAAELDVLLDHLQSCDTCVQKLGSLPTRERLVERVRQVQARRGGPSAEVVTRLLERLANRALEGDALEEQATVPPDASMLAAPLTFACPACGKTLKVKAALAGKKGKCPHCKEGLRVPRESPAQTAGVQSSPSDRLTQSGALAVANDGDTAAHEADNHNQELTAFLAPAQAPDELGRLGPYRVLQVLGAGGMGVVFRAEDPHLQRLVALKAMLPGLAASAAAKQRFLREARAAAAIKHDHIVTIFQVGEDRGAPFLAMEFLEGEPLDVRLKRERRLPVVEVLRIGREMAEGLAAAHDKGLVHRDIKPANVWLEGKKARVKILDFGLARATSGEQNLTQTGAIVGTPSYMAPEQAQGKALDARCDLFSLGCVLYRLATGELPFKGTDTISTLMAVATENPRPPGQVNGAVPAALSDLVMGLLAKKPEGRPASAQKVVEELEAIAAQPILDKKRPPETSPPQMGSPTRTLRAAPATSSRRSAVPGGRNRAALLAAGGIVLLALLIGVYFLVTTLLRVQTAEGTLVVEIPDAEANNVQLAVKHAGRQIELLDLKTKKEIKLSAGTYQLELVGGKDGLRLETNHFDLKRGDKLIARVTYEPRANSGAPKDGASDPKGILGDFRSLFNGNDLTGWVMRRGQPASWKVDNGYMEAGAADIQTEELFGPDFELRAEFWLPLMAGARGQGRANSGIFLQGRYEIQVLDNYQNDTFANGMVGALFGLIAPDREALDKAIRPPQQWNTYDILFHAPQGEAGRVLKDGRVTVILNGITVIQDGRFDRVTTLAIDNNLGAPGPILLQGRNAPVRFRNLRIRKLGP